MITNIRQQFTHYQLYAALKLRSCWMISLQCEASVQRKKYIGLHVQSDLLVFHIHASLCEDSYVYRKLYLYFTTTNCLAFIFRRDKIAIRLIMGVDLGRPRRCCRWRHRAASDMIVTSGVQHLPQPEGRSSRSVAAAWQAVMTGVHAVGDRRRRLTCKKRRVVNFSSAESASSIGEIKQEACRQPCHVV